MVEPSLSLRGTEVAGPDAQRTLGERLVRSTYAENPGPDPQH